MLHACMQFYYNYNYTSLDLTFLLFIADCGPVSAPDHGSVFVENNDTTVGAVALYQCNTDYYLISRDAKRVCQDDGKWSGEVGMCIYLKQDSYRMFSYGK